MEYIIRRVFENEKDKIIALSEKTLTNLDRKEFFGGIGPFILDNFFKEDMFITFGAFDMDKLIAFSLISRDENDLLELKKLLNLTEKTAEIGASMVDIDYRGNNLMYIINQKLIEQAKLTDIKHIVATAHPDNISSNTSLQKVGLKKISFINRYGVKPRNVYLLNL